MDEEKEKPKKEHKSHFKTGHSKRPPAFKHNTEARAMPDFNELRRVARLQDLSNRVDTGFDEAKDKRNPIESLPTPERPALPEKSNGEPKVKPEVEPEVKIEPHAKKFPTAEKADEPGETAQEEYLPVATGYIWESPIFTGLSKSLANQEDKVPEISFDVLPPGIREYAEAVSKETQTPSGLAINLVLSILALCNQKKIVIWPKASYFETASLWTATMLESGAGKTPAFHALMKPINEWTELEANSIEEDVWTNNNEIEIAEKAILLRSAELSKPSKPAKSGEIITTSDEIRREIQNLRRNMPEKMFLPELTVRDINQEAAQNCLQEQYGRLGLFDDDAGGVLDTASGISTGGIPAIGVWLNGYSGGEVKIHRISRKVSVKHAAISMGISFQPSVLFEMPDSARRALRGRGYFSRFFMLCPDMDFAKIKFLNNYVIPDGLYTTYRNIIFGLLNRQMRFAPKYNKKGEIIPNRKGEVIPRNLRLHPEAFEIHQKFGDKLWRKRAKYQEYEDIRDFINKLPGGIARVALQYHSVEAREDDDIVPPRTMKLACDFGIALIPHQKKCFGMLGQDQGLEDLKRVEDWILQDKKADFSRRDIFEKVKSPSIKNIPILKRLLKTLEENHIIRNYKTGRTQPPDIPQTEESLKKKGSDRCVVNPEIVKGWE